MEHIDSILENSEIGKLNMEIKEILDALTAYYKIVDTSKASLKTTQKSIDYHNAEIIKCKGEYKNMLVDCMCHKKRSINEMSLDPQYLKCAGEYQQHKVLIDNLTDQMQMINEKIEKMNGLIQNYESQLDIKKGMLIAKLNEFSN
jgi:hypothetical protein